MQELLCCARLDQLVEIIGLGVVADQVRIALAAVILNRAGAIVIVVDDKRARWARCVFGGFDCIFEKFVVCRRGR